MPGAASSMPMPCFGLALSVRAERVLAVTDVNLYARDLNFVFGIAQPSGEACVISLFRLYLDADEEHFLILQFWQNLQPRLQPLVPNDSTGDPGRKWLSAFFSTGSNAEAAGASIGRQHHLVALPRLHEAEGALTLM